MTNAEIDFIRRMIMRYNSYAEGPEKKNLRNEIYIEILPFMKKWISAITAKNHTFLDSKEILSKSWDCFEYCLETYKTDKNSIPLPNHFYKYTLFYLKTHRIDFNIPTNLFSKEIISSLEQDDYPVLQELDTFRSLLDKEHQLVFDDALKSLLPWNKDRQYRVKESTLSLPRYQESKKIFKIVIDFLLRR